MTYNAEHLKKLEMMKNTKLMRLKGINSENEEIKVFYLENKIQNYRKDIKKLTLQFYKNKLDHFKYLSEMKKNFKNLRILKLQDLRI